MNEKLLATLIKQGGAFLIDRAVKRVTKVPGGKPARPAEAIIDQEPHNTGPAKPSFAPSNIAKALSGAALTRLATRSVPGAIIIGGGILAKMAYDRKRAQKDKTGRG